MTTSKQNEHTWIKVGELSGKMYADMITELLEQNDIPHFVKSDVMTTTFSISSSEATGGLIKLFVPEKYKEKAESLLHTVVG
ncbi:MAG: hypothetical protein HOD97_07290 [Candidatus Marinimicrobia bacterium]|jgi:hypothetical protein|nr:hypothetical protein [Candidatus Neomarinimicrobiota bacterium]MBT3617623.1 hypothetical protein [Candidatus Neomarinimicrobiota bacterium]MBT3829103.1 hypothetical protein [Candidatus Neomarinimicrobiota bacterium]MBT3997715.1 hypothetical protein [Candidatus Neomarinimicrobiota bacterium]MBT4281398.1 hypothetical protein [Candidatus Neomarinimicrobiota bacterium]